MECAGITINTLKQRLKLPQMSKVRKMFRFAILWLFILVQDLYFSLPLPFLTHEIVENRGQSTIVGGILAGTFPLVTAVTSFTAGFVVSKTNAKTMTICCGVASFLSSIVFAIPMSNNAGFDATVFISR